MTEESRGSLYVIWSTLFFTISTAIVKLLSGSMDSLTISALRFVIGTVAGFALLWQMGVPFRIKGVRLWTFRGFLGCFTMVLYYKTIELNGIAWTTLLVNTSAFFIALNGRLFFGQDLKGRTLMGITLAFCGIIIIYYSGGEISIAGTALGLSVAFLRGFSAHVIKITSQENHPIIVYMAATLAGLILFPVAWNDMVRTAPLHIVGALVAGLVVFFAHVSFTAGLKRIRPDKSSLLLFTGIPLALAVGFFMGEEMNFRFLAGSLLIGGGILLDNLLKKREDLIRGESL